MVSDQGRLVAGRYRLVESIGRGGMGTVWLAEDELLGRQVAVKKLRVPPELQDDERERLYERTRREARSAARITHPNVVVVHDVVEDDGLPCVVMEYVRSRTLSDVLKNDGPITPKEAARIGRGMVAALRAAHRAGVLHRDVKPANVLLGTETPHGDDGWPGGRVVLTDFGIASATGTSTLTRTGELIGSFDYLAPERITGGTPGPASDLWALGATLYQAVEGVAPFHRDTPIETAYAIASEPIVPPRNAGPLVPVIESLLAKEPEQRMTGEQVERLLVSSVETVLSRHPGAPHSDTTTVMPGAGTTSGTGGGSGTTDGAGTSGITGGAGTTNGTGASGDPVGRDAYPPTPFWAIRDDEAEGPTTSFPRQSTGPESWDAHAAYEAPAPQESGTPPTGTTVHPTGDPHSGRPAPDDAAHTDSTPHPGDTGTGGSTGTGDTRRPHDAARPDGSTGPGDSTGASRERRRRGNGLPMAVASVIVVAVATGGVLLLARQGALPWQKAGGASPSPVVPRPSHSPVPAPTAPAGYHMVHDSNGFSVAVPNGWIRKAKGKEEIDYISPDSASELVISTLDYAGPALQHWIDLEKVLKAKQPDYYQERMNATPVTVGNTTYEGAIWEWTWEGTVPYHAIDLGFGKPGGTEYAVYVSAPDAQWSEKLPVFNVATHTFRPTG